jgi:Queuosine biosynthesis protein QueC
MQDTPRTAAQGPVHTRALVLFSGGQDSTACLAYALQKFAHVETVGFDYGQRHSIELVQRLTVLKELRQQFPAWSSKLGDDHVLDLAVLGKVSETSLTRETAFKMEQSGLPNTFVPGRNLLFLTLAAALARSASDCHRRVRDRLLRLPRLPRRHHESDAIGPVAGYGQTLFDRHAVDVDRQNPNMEDDARPGHGIWCN